MPALLIIRHSSRVVREISMSCCPELLISALRWISNFLAVHGMMDTTKRFLGSRPIFSA